VINFNESIKYLSIEWKIKMLYRKCLFFLILNIIGCDANYSYTPLSKKSFKIEIPRGSINYVTPVDWRVGRGGKRKTISKGIRLSLKLPVITKGDLEDIYKKVGSDAWLLRISRKGPEGGTKVLGNIYLPLTKGKARGSSRSLNFKRLKRAVFSIYYSAAAHSKRFENFPCPAFGHDKIIPKARIINATSKRPSKLSVHYRDSAGVSGKLKIIAFTTRINGGMKMAGNYIFELAFFNSARKVRKGPFVKFKEEIVIPQEAPVDIRSCSGFTPKGLPGEKRFRQFKFGR